MNEYPTPTLLALNDDAQRTLLVAAQEGLARLANDEPIEALTFQQVLGLVAIREAELAAFVTELDKRRRALNN